MPGPGIIKASVGKSITLPCEAIGVPVPETMWHKEGRKLQINDLRMIQMDSGLMIDGVEEGDAGTYMCLVASRAGADRKYITLQVISELNLFILWNQNM